MLTVTSTISHKHNRVPAAEPSGGLPSIEVGTSFAAASDVNRWRDPGCQGSQPYADDHSNNPFIFRVVTAMTARVLTLLQPLAIVGVLVTLSGCSTIVATSPAPHANSIACANVTVRLPATVAGLSRRETNAQATAAWGDPASVLLRCGIRAPAASTLPCVTIDSVFWLQDKGTVHSVTYTSYGRDPAITITIDPSKVSAGNALGDLSSSVELTPVNGHQCLGGSNESGPSSPSPAGTPEPAP